MDKETKNKVMLFLIMTAFLMLTAFQKKAESSQSEQPVSIDETVTTLDALDSKSIVEEIDEEVENSQPSNNLNSEEPDDQMDSLEE
jgi:hypothetical protein